MLKIILFILALSLGLFAKHILHTSFEITSLQHAKIIGAMIVIISFGVMLYVSKRVRMSTR